MKNNVDLLPASDEETRQSFTLCLERAAREEAKDSMEYDQELEKRMTILKENRDVISSILRNESSILDDGLQCLKPDISSMSIECCELNDLYDSSKMDKDNNEIEHGQRSDSDNSWIEGKTEESNNKDKQLEKDEMNDSFLFGIDDLEDCLTMYDLPTNDTILGFDTHLEVSSNELDCNDSCVASGVQILTGCTEDSKSEFNMQFGRKKKRGKVGRPSKKQMSKKGSITEKSGTQALKVPLSAKEARMKRLAKRRQKKHVPSK